MNNQAVISIRALKKFYPVTRGLLFTRVTGQVKAVDDISFNVRQGETLGLVGESGCGKSTTANLILGLEVPTSGQILFEGRDITGLKGKDLFEFRGAIQAVFQDPFRSLNPRKKVKQIISEPLVVHKAGSKAEISNRVDELMELVGLDAAQAKLYPHEFSGGQRQRIAVARALALNPGVIILDEPVSALDVSIQAQILNLLFDLQKQLNLTYIIISHDLAVVEYVSTRIGVMYLGRLVELAPSEVLCKSPKHPYSRALLDSVPVADPENIKEVSLEGEAPSPLNPPGGCTFHPRCRKRMPECSKVEPGTQEVDQGHYVTCLLYK